MPMTHLSSKWKQYSTGVDVIKNKRVYYFIINGRKYIVVKCPERISLYDCEDSEYFESITIEEIEEIFTAALLQRKIVKFKYNRFID